MKGKFTYLKTYRDFVLGAYTKSWLTKKYCQEIGILMNYDVYISRMMYIQDNNATMEKKMSNFKSTECLILYIAYTFFLRQISNT